MRKLIASTISFMVLSGILSSNAMADSTDALLQVPSLNVLTASCLRSKSNGVMELDFRNTPSETCTTNQWYTSTFHVPASRTPGGIEVYYNARQPANTNICVVLKTYNSTNSLSYSAVECGGGSRQVSAGAPSNLGRVELEVWMHSSSTSAKPALRNYGSTLYVWER